MAKSGRNNGKYKQDSVTSQFSRDIYQDSKRNWLNVIESSIVAGEAAKKKVKPVSDVRISFYDPSNPLNGSSTWSKQKRQEYKSK